MTALSWISLINLQVQSAKPNILVIWGDDIGITNISAYRNGLMGYSCRGCIWSDRTSEYIRSNLQRISPRSIPPSFSPTTIMEDMLNGIKMDNEI